MRLRLAARLGLGYGVLIAMLVGVVAADLSAASIARASSQRVQSNILPDIDAADQLLIEVQRMQTSELLMRARADQGARWQQQFDQAAAGFEQQFGRLGDHVSSASGRGLLDSIGRQFGAYRQVEARLHRLMAAGDGAGAQALANTDALDVATQLVDATRRFRSFELDLDRRVSADGDRALQDAQGLGLAAAALAIALAALIWWRTTRDVVAPLAELAVATSQLETGGAARAAHPAAARTVELADLQARFNQAANRLALVTGELRAINASLETQVADRTAELQRLVEELRTLDKLKSDFMAIASHELLTPINFISGFGSSLEDGLFGPLSDPQGEAVRKMLAGAERLTRMVRKILVCTQLQGDQLTLSPQAVDLAALVRDVAQALVPERGITVDIDAPPTLPAARVDPDWLGLVAYELLDNAIKFSPDGAQVAVSLAVANGITLAIRDQGAGMPAAVLPHLFEPFYQADATSTRAHGGLGLGLALAHGIVTRSGGTLAVETGEGQGTLVRVELPRA